jgi:ABC-type transport system involved in multi-copper enzyme maturation permease subunit
MHMLDLPIARRELLVLSRVAATWKGRAFSSALVLIFGVLLALVYHYGVQMVLTQVMHLVGTGLSLMCLFAGVTLTADSIAQEKRGGTLGLLFLTHLSAFEIVLGKLIAHAVVGFYTVLCALPLLSMSMIFGGMRFADVLMYLLSALNILFFSAAAGLCASSICYDKKRASSLGTLIILFFWMGAPLLATILNAIGSPRWLIDVLTRCSVHLSTTLGFGVGLGRLLPSTAFTWWNLLWTHILGWLFVGLAVWWLLRHWQEKPSRKRAIFRELWKAISLGPPAGRLKLRRKLLDRNPFMWLASRDRLQAAIAWIVTVSLVAFVGFILFQAPLRLELMIIVGVAMSIVLQLTFSSAAGAQLYREYEQGTLEMILSTPLSEHDVIDGQFAAVLRQYRSLFVLTFLLLLAGLVMLLVRGGTPESIAAAALVVYSGLLLLQFYTIGWVGMWSIVIAPDPKKASTNAFFYITILPGLLFGLLNALAQLFVWLVGIRFSPGPKLLVPVLFTVAFAIAFTNCIYWLRRAKRELPRELRLFAFRRYTPHERLTLLGMIGRLLGTWIHRARAMRKKVVLNPR